MFSKSRSLFKIRLKIKLFEIRIRYESNVRRRKKEWVVIITHGLIKKADKIPTSNIWWQSGQLERFFKN